MEHKPCAIKPLQIAALIAACAFSGVSAAGTCKPVSGVVSPLVPVTPCSSPFGCFQGQITGDLNGTFSSQLTGIRVDNSDIEFSAITTVQLPQGTISTVDVGTGSNCVPGTLQCEATSEILRIVSGTRAYTQAYGSVTLSNVGFIQPGTYQGSLCHGSPSQDRPAE
jgi:hypothetical protein